MNYTPLPPLNAHQLNRMVDVSRKLNSAPDLDQLLKLIIDEAADLTNAEAASILLFDSQTRQLRFKATSGEMPPALDNVPVSIHNSIAGTVWQSNAPLIIDDVSRDSRWSPKVDQAINFRTGSILGVPMHDVERPVGVLESINKREGQFTQEDVAILSTLADLAGVAVEKARLIGQLQKANQKLSELDRLKSDFIALASHELRTPLAIILGYVSFLREEADPSMMSHLDSVMKASIRLRDLIQDMLNLRYVDSGSSILQKDQVDLVEFVRKLLYTRDDTSALRQSPIHFRAAAEALPVALDQDMMEVVLSNLLSNAVKFTAEGGKIEVRLGRRDDEAWFCVADTGIGLAQDQLERIFDRFYQVEPHMARHYEGMGLGLAIARDLVNLHDGRIWVESQPEKGSNFYVALPLAKST
jgi:signal transduction histidine kinase